MLAAVKPTLAYRVPEEGSDLHEFLWAGLQAQDRQMSGPVIASVRTGCQFIVKTLSRASLQFSCYACSPSAPWSHMS